MKSLRFAAALASILNMPILLANVNYLLTQECNLPRTGDRLTVRHIQYPHEIEVGDSVVWDYSGLEAVGGFLSIGWPQVTDSTLLQARGQAINLYKLHGDSIDLQQQREPGKLLKYAITDPWLSLPAGYNSAHESHFYGEGNLDGSRFLRQAGVTQWHIMGRGQMITPDGDTLRHVLLQHHVRHGITGIAPHFSQSVTIGGDSSVLCRPAIEHLLSTDSVTHYVETMTWWARGYRYPILQSERVITCFNGVPADSVKTAWYASPTSQEETLDYDEPNVEMRLINAREAYEHQHRSPVSNPSGQRLGEAGLACTVSPTAVVSSTALNLTSSYPTDVTVGLYNTAGMLLWRRQCSVDGFATLDCDMSDLPAGEYLVTVISKEKNFTFKVIKVQQK